MDSTTYIGVLADVITTVGTTPTVSADDIHKARFMETCAFPECLTDSQSETFTDFVGRRRCGNSPRTVKRHILIEKWEDGLTFTSLALPRIITKMGGPQSDAPKCVRLRIDTVNLPSTDSQNCVQHTSVRVRNDLVKLPSTNG